MSIAEKLALIAENEQKVYDAGYEKGKASVPSETVEEWDGSGVVIEEIATLISFTIDGTSYQAEEGMTWADWVESEYDTGGFTIVTSGGNLIVYLEGEKVSTNANGGTVYSTDTITADYDYYLMSSTDEK